MLLRSAILALILMAIQGAINSQPSLFGTKVSSLGAGIVQFYPRAAIFETLKIALLATMVIFIYGLWFRFASIVVSRQRNTSRGRPRAKLPFVSLLFLGALSWFLVTVGSVVEFPAIYEASLPDWFLRGVYHLAHMTSPFWLKLVGATILVVPAIPRLLRRTDMLPTLGILLATVAILGLCLAPMGVSWWSLPRRVSSQSKPHVIWIAIDSLRSDRIDRDGLLKAIKQFRDDPRTVDFKRHHVGVPRTFPSWIEMIQGRFAAETGIRHMFPGFPPRDDSFDGIISLARNDGYHTAAISDFAGDIFPRFSTGFDEVKAPGMSLGTIIRQNIDQMFPLFVPIVTSPLARPLFPALKSSPAYAVPGHLEDQVAETIKKMPPAKPLFLTLFYSTAHFPYAAPWPYYKMFANPDYPGPFWFQKNPSLTVSDQELDHQQIKQVRALYDGALQSVDDSFHRLMNQLKASGIWDDAIVVLTADHGEDLFEEGILQGHGDHLRGDQTLRVPLLIKLPRSFPPPSDRVIETISRSIDVAPTLASVAGIAGFPSPQHDLQGHDLVPLLEASQTKGAHNFSLKQKLYLTTVKSLPAYSETEIWFARSGDVFYQKNRLDYPGISQLLVFDPGRSGDVILNPKYEKMVVLAKHRCLVHGRWKLIYMPTPSGVKYELYDVELDPENHKNLVADEAEVLALMKRRLFRRLRRLESDVRIIDEFIVPEGA